MTTINNAISGKVVKFPGEIKTLKVIAGSTVTEVLKDANIEFGSGMSIKVNGVGITDLSGVTVNEDGFSILITGNIAGA